MEPISRLKDKLYMLLLPHHRESVGRCHFVPEEWFVSIGLLHLEHGTQSGGTENDQSCSCSNISLLTAMSWIAITQAITFHFKTSKKKQASSYMPNWEKHLPFSGSQSDHFASLARIQRHATSKFEPCVLIWSLKISSTVSLLIESLAMNSSTSGAKVFKSRLTCFSMETSRLAVFRLPLAHSSGSCSGNTTRLGVSLSHLQWNGACWANRNCNTARPLTCQGGS